MACPGHKPFPTTGMGAMVLSSVPAKHSAERGASCSEPGLAITSDFKGERGVNISPGPAQSKEAAAIRAGHVRLEQAGEGDQSCQAGARPGAHLGSVTGCPPRGRLH